MAIRIYNDGGKITANELAKWLICDKAETAFYFDKDDHGLTERERELVVECMDKQIDRIRKILGINKILNKSR